MKISILFGAGASHGAGDILPSPPPLGGQLYNELSLHFPLTWNSIPVSLRGSFTPNFEIGMDKLWVDYSSSVPSLMKDMGVYFSRFSPGLSGTDLYAQLIKHIDGRGILDKTAFSTLNYECVLEIAGSKLGHMVEYFSDKHSSKSNLLVLKLHGSCNFKVRNMDATRNVMYTRGVVFDGGIEAINPPDVLAYCHSNTSLYPCMSIYALGKPTQMSSSVIQQIQTNWKNWLYDSESAFVIGVHPNPADTHIWDSLSSFNGELFYVGAHRPFMTWKNKYRPKRKSTWLGATFGDSFSDIIALL